VLRFCPRFPQNCNDWTTEQELVAQAWSKDLILTKPFSFAVWEYQPVFRDPCATAEEEEVEGCMILTMMRWTRMNREA